MAKFICKKCKSEKDLANYKLGVVDGNVVCKEAQCCDAYMERVRETFEGWGSIKKGPNGTVKRKTRPWE